MSGLLTTTALNISSDGLDEREDILTLSDGDPRITSAGGVAALFTMGELESAGNGQFFCTKKFTEVKFEGQMFPLCDGDNGEKFIGQPTGAIGTGVLVAPDIVATASHNLPDDAHISEVIFVFDFLMIDNQTVAPIKAENMYNGDSVIRREDAPMDWALVRLDRKVAQPNRVRALDLQGQMFGRKVYTIGCPCGLPVKLCGSAIIWEAGEEFFMAGLDAYKGNSGSPVFDAESHKVVGLVFSDEARDFELDATGNCCKSRVVPINEASGDKCVKVSRFAEFIP